MAPVIDQLPFYPSGASELIAIASAVAIVIAALTRIIKASQPFFKERQRTLRAATAERERTRRASSIHSDHPGQITITGPLAAENPRAALELLAQAQRPEPDQTSTAEDG